MNRAGRRQGAALPACRFRGIGGAAPDGSEAKRTPVPLPLDNRQLGAPLWRGRSPDPCRHTSGAVREAHGANARRLRVGAPPWGGADGPKGGGPLARSARHGVGGGGEQARSAHCAKRTD